MDGTTPLHQTVVTGQEPSAMAVQDLNVSLWVKSLAGLDQLKILHLSNNMRSTAHSSQMHIRSFGQYLSRIYVYKNDIFSFQLLGSYLLIILVCPNASQNWNRHSSWLRTSKMLL